MQMKRRVVLFKLVTAPLLLGLASTQILYAARFKSDLTLDAYIQLSLTGRAPIVHSKSSASLIDDSGNRIYNQEVILTHRIRDVTNASDRFTAKVVTEIGFANSSSGDLQGDYGICYDAQMRALAYAVNASDEIYALQQCIPDLNQPPPHVFEENCPVLLDLAQDGFHLSGPDTAVRFDIDADGVLDNIAWTQAGGDDAFLCMDRNHNGVIDNGSELFGYATPLLSGKPAKVGYRALADLDMHAAGGNSDGVIDSRDLLFHELCAWIDKNRDGVSQPEEIFSLDQVGVSYIEYDYKPIRLFDSYGNLFRYMSRVGMRAPGGGVTSWPTFDVVFGER
jgi:hypothetical protein